MLGSATPSLESWQRAARGPLPAPRLAGARRRRRAAAGAAVRHEPACRVQPRRSRHRAARAAARRGAARAHRARRAVACCFLNRRGYAPVLHCADCGWKSGCPHCSAWRVFHKARPHAALPPLRLRRERVPRACPDCGNARHRAGRPRHRAARGAAGACCCPARASPASTPTPRAATARSSARLAEVHAGDVDVLVGTQMVAKGHDFRRITLVAAVNPDSALFSSDFRAPERLFALLMQAAGRAGRDARRRRAARCGCRRGIRGTRCIAALRRARLRGLCRGAAGRTARRRAAAVRAPGAAARRGAHGGRGARASCTPPPRPRRRCRDRPR